MVSGGDDVLGKLIAGMLMAAIGLNGGYAVIEEILPAELVVMVEPDVEDLTSVTNEEMKSAEAVIKARLDSAGLIELKVKRDGDYRIKIEAPDKEMEDVITEAVSKKAGKLQFLDADGNVAVDGSEKYIESARATFGPIDEYGNAQHYVAIYFTPEGQAAFKAATEAAVAKIASGENYIPIVVDSVVYSVPSVYEVIDSDSCIITGDFDKETATDLANVINAGRLDFGFKIVE